VVGRADAEQSDFFKVNVKAGQRLSIETLGRRLGSPFDPQISLLDPRTEREVAYSNDAPGLQTDARLTYKFKQDGDYIIEIRDVMYRGGPDYCYRIRLGDFPCATTPIPMAAKRGSRLNVEFAGPQLDGVAPVEVAVPDDPAARIVWVTPRGANGLAGWPVALLVSNLEEVLEKEPNNELAKANRIPVPGAVTARFQEKGDIDYFVFGAKKGQRFLIEAHTHEQFSPTEVYMVLKNKAGGQITAINPAAEPRIEFTAPEEGDYFLAVEHLNYWGGPDESYRITLTTSEPGFVLNTSLDRYDVPQDGVVAVPIQSIARKDYAGPIEISLTGADDLTGKTVVSPAAALGPNQPAAWLFVRASPGAPLGPRVCRLEAKATINGKLVTAYAGTRAAVSQELAGLTYPPPDLTHQIGIAIAEKPPFTLIARFASPEALRGSPIPLTISASRATGFDGEIAFSAIGLPANVTAAFKNIPKGQNEIKFQLSAAANAALGRFPVSFSGKSKHQNKEYTVTAEPISLTLALPFELVEEPRGLDLEPGKKAKAKVTALRKGGYKGPIALEARNLPAGVTATKAIIEDGKTDAEIEFTAASGAAPVEKKDVNFLGVATALGNQQNTSPPITIHVKKK
jgi:hypothetical protein